MQFDIRSLSAGHGWQWLTEAWTLFKRRPGLFIGMGLVYLVLAVVMSLVPFLGQIGTQLFAPVLTTGYLLAVRAVDAGEPAKLGTLFAAFSSPNFGRLLGLGALGLGLALVVTVVVMVLFMGTFGGAMHHSDTAAALTMSGGGVVLIVALLVVAALLYFAVPLVGLGDVPVFESVALSFKGCLRNWLPLLVFSLFALLFGLLASLPILLGWIVFAPVLMMVPYTAAKDIYLPLTPAP